MFLSDVEMFVFFNAFSGHVDRFERIKGWVARISGRISQVPQHTCVLSELGNFICQDDFGQGTVSRSF